MNIEMLREYCIHKKAVEECFPFDESTLVFKVGGKVFLLVSLNRVPLQFNVKCDPEKAVELREEYDCVKHGYHMSKKHWNTVICDGSIKDKLFFDWIDHSYELVFTSLTKKIKADIETIDDSF